MIKNLNDILSFIVLIFLTLYSLKIFLGALMFHNNQTIVVEENKESFFEQLRDYNNNTQE